MENPKNYLYSTSRDQMFMDLKLSKELEKETSRRFFHAPCHGKFLSKFLI
jgi:hypothetical protein